MYIPNGYKTKKLAGSHQNDIIKFATIQLKKVIPAGIKYQLDQIIDFFQILTRSEKLAIMNKIDNSILLFIRLKAMAKQTEGTRLSTLIFLGVMAKF
jgi:hypothetical protein